MRNLRRTREPASRNSAKRARNLGISAAPAETQGASEQRPRRLFTKNTAIREGASRRMGGDTCPVPEG